MTEEFEKGDRIGSSTDPTLNGQLRYPNNLDQSPHDKSPDKVRKYRSSGLQYEHS